MILSEEEMDASDEGYASTPWMKSGKNAASLNSKSYGYV
jgi:hypothetical protein